MSDILNYQTRGTCCRQMRVEIENDIIKNIEFLGGCHGNLQGIAHLVVGMNINDVKNKLQGIRCADKPTSCPDQLSQCLNQYIEQKLKTGV